MTTTTALALTGAVLLLPAACAAIASRATNDLGSLAGLLLTLAVVCFISAIWLGAGA